MEQNKLEKLELSIKNLKEKTNRIYLFVQDTKGNPKAAVRYIYQLGISLRENGFNPTILHEKTDYVGVAEWLGEEYMKLPHKSIDGQNLEISPDDFLIIPEIFGFVMEQVKDLPCAKIVLCQSYDYMMETLQPGMSWSTYGFFKCITTSDFQKEYISSIMKGTTIDVLEPYLSDVFKKTNLTQQPMIAVHSRDQRKTLNFIKIFYLRYPQYRWVTFKDMRGLTESEFAHNLKDCCGSVWIDDISGYGTFPLESMKCGVPCIGKVPNLTPSWMKDENGFWINDEILLTDFTADFIQNWLEDNIKPELYTEMDNTVESLPTKESFNSKVKELFESYLSVRLTAFEEQLTKLTPVE